MTADGEDQVPTRLEDLAELADVSISTVSRALNDSPLISKKTKRLILDLAQSSNYEGKVKPGLMTSAMAPSISLIIPPPLGRDSRLADAFLLDLIGGIGDALREQGYDLLLSHHSIDEMDSLLPTVMSGKTAGLIVLGQSDQHDLLNSLVDKNVPFVVWGGQLEGQRYCTVGSDNFQGGKRAANHLLRLGRRKIAFLGDTEAPEAKIRCAGYKSALEESGITVDERLIRPAKFYPESAIEATEVLLEGKMEFDGIVAASDMIAIGAVRALLSSGLTVPGDVSVIGYDDINLAAYSSPSLTTVRQSVSKAGRMLVSKLMRAIEGETVRSGFLPTELIVRESCGG